MAFNGANISENMAASANGGRVRFTRDIANIVMDLNDVEAIAARTLGGADNVVVGDLSGTDLVRVDADMAAGGGGDDLSADNVVVNATNGAEIVTVAGAGSSMQVGGLAAEVTMTGGVAP